MSEFDILATAAAGMDAQRAALDVAARNVAAAQTVPDGSFARLIPRFALAPAAGDGADGFPNLDEPGLGGDAGSGLDDLRSGLTGVRSGFEPPEPGSDEPGFVGGEPEFDAGRWWDGAAASEAPPIRFLGTSAQRGVEADSITEMVALLDAQRGFEANASVFDLGKRLAERTIEVGRP